VTDRIIGPSGGKRRRRFWALLSLSLLGVLAFAINSFAGPVGTGQGFEDDDGNLAPDPSGINFDWNSFDPVTWSPSSSTTPTRQTVAKTVSGFQFKGVEDYPNPGASSGTTSDTSFNGGVKQDNDCGGVGVGKPPNKDDLTRIYLASKTGSNGHTYLDLAWARIPQNSTSASAHVGFEFSQGTTACPAGSNGLVRRTVGDVLVVYDFEGGSGAPVLTLRRWLTDPSDPAQASYFTNPDDPCDVDSNAPPCWGDAKDLTAGGFAEGKVNTANVVDALSPPALGTNPGTSVDRTLATQEFGEAGIDLTAAGVIPANTCASFGKAYAVSRSSGQSSQAQMKDLVGPAPFSLTNCGEIKIIKRTNPRGLNQNFSFTSNIAGGQLSCTADTTPAGFTLNDNGNTTSDSSGNTEDCINVPAGSYTVTEGANPTGFAFESLTCTATGTGSSGSQDGTVPKQANITLAGGGVVTCVYVNKQQLGAIKVSKTSSKGGGNLAGAEFTVTGPNSFSQKLTTDSSGTACVDNLSFGSYSVTETKAPTGYVIDDSSAHTVTVDSNAKCSDSPYVGEGPLNFTDTPVADIQVRFRDGGSGETHLDGSISCDNATGTASNADTTGWDDTHTVTGIKVDGKVTITCTIPADP
jgi:hypothetical protein